MDRGRAAWTRTRSRGARKTSIARSSWRASCSNASGAETAGSSTRRPGTRHSAAVVAARSRVKENAVAAEVLIAARPASPHDESYATRAERALRAVLEHRRGAGLLRGRVREAVDLLLNPGARREDRRVTGGGGALHAAALARRCRPDDPRHRGIRAGDAGGRGLPATPAPAAYVCYGTLCSAPVTTPDDLFEIVDRTRQAYESTRRREPLAAPRGGKLPSD